MAAKTSQAMLDARKMIEKGATPYRAAKDCGLTISAITRSPWYKQFVVDNVRDIHPETPMERARKMIVEGGSTAYEASKMTGVAQSSISRAAWYREFTLAKVAAGFPAVAADALKNYTPGVSPCEN